MKKLKAYKKSKDNINVNKKKIPFEIDSDPFYSKKNLERLKKSIEKLEKTI